MKYLFLSPGSHSRLFNFPFWCLQRLYTEALTGVCSRSRLEGQRERSCQNDIKATWYREKERKFSGFSRFLNIAGPASPSPAAHLRSAYIPLRLKYKCQGSKQHTAQAQACIHSGTKHCWKRSFTSLSWCLTLAPAVWDEISSEKWQKRHPEQAWNSKCNIPRHLYLELAGST